MSGDADVIETQVAVATADPVESTVTADQNAETATAKPEEEKAQKPDPVQKRIDKLTREKYQLRGELDALRRQSEQAAQQAQPRQEQPRQGDPKLEDFNSFDDYIAAKAEAIAERKIRASFEERETRANERAQADQQAKASETWQQRLDDARKGMDDFDDVIESADVVLTPAMGSAIMDSDMGPQIAYYLARNPDEAQKLASLSPSAVLRAIGRIEVKLENEASAKKTSSAPKPVTPIGGRSAGASNPEAMSDADWIASRRAQQVKRKA